jgi:hypothetical protein
MAIDQLPFNVKIPTNEPESTGIDQLDNQVVEEEVTWKDFPPPGALLMRAPSEREKIAMKNFGQGLINFQEQMSLDLIPGLGEHRMQGYTNEEIDLFKQAIEREDYPAATVHGIGTPIMAAGMLPWWFGIPGKWLSRAYRSATAPFRRKASSYLEQGNQLIGSTGTQNYQTFTRIINTPEKRVAYEQWLKGLPEYRRVAETRMVQRNLEEFQLLTPERIAILDAEGRAEAAVGRGMPDASRAQIYKEFQKNVQEQKVKHKASVSDKTKMLESGSVPTRITEKFTLGESLTPVRTGTAATTSEFLGSQAYDVIGMANFNQMPVKNMTEYLAGMVRSGKLKKEELFDSGLLKLDANNKPIGGTLFDLSSNTPNMVIGKQDILKILKESPAQNLKIKTYKSATVSPAVYYDLYATTTMMGNTMDNFLQKAIFATKNTAARSKLRQVQKDIKALDKSMYHTANDLKFDNSNFQNVHFVPMVERMNNLLPSLDSGTQQVLRAYIENAKKINKMANQGGVTKKGHVEAFKASGGTHSGFESAHSLPGGFNYQEKVIYLDEAIPFNTGKGRTRFTSHFPVDNPIVHIRSKSRYDRSGNPIIAIEEIQSDTLQPFWGKPEYKSKREAMTSPFGTALTEAHVRRRLNEINKEMEPFLPKNLKTQVEPGQWVNRTMTDKELKHLQKLDAEKAELRKFLIKQDAQLEGAATGAIRSPTGEKVDFFPYLRRTGGVPGYDMLAIKTMVDDAIRSGQKGVTIVPAGVGNRASDAGMYLFYGDSRGTKIRGLTQKALPGGKKKKVSPDAIYVDALRKIAKQIEKEHGIKLKVVQREIFNYDPMKLYAIENKSGQVIASFKTRQNRDFVLAKKNEMSPSGEGFNAINFGEGAPGSPEMRKGSFKSIVLEIPDSAAKILSKKKMSTYREGGLVAIAPKREYFAAVI